MAANSQRGRSAPAETTNSRDTRAHNMPLVYTGYRMTRAVLLTHATHTTI